jgi:fibro-slime domain-containing protein
MLRNRFQPEMPRMRNAFLATGLLLVSGIGCSANDATTPNGLSSTTGSGATGGSATDPTGSGGAGAGTGTGTGGSVSTTTGAGGTISIDPNGGTGATDENMAQSCDGKLKAVIRDFTPMHLDFEVAESPTVLATYNPAYPPRASNKFFQSDPGIVAPILGEDFKPVYAADPVVGSPTTTGKANFDQWFRDTPGVNMTTEYWLQFEDPDGDGVWTFDNGGEQFFPIDGELLGNYEWGNGRHNYHMTLELHSKFIYKPGMQFTFSGDDDVWVFINNQLVVDLGGVHTKAVGVANLDLLGLTPGQTYQLDFFWAERHIIDSNFRIDTSIQFIDCGIDVPR